MTTNPPVSGVAIGLPKLTDIHEDALRLRGLITALDRLADLGGPDSDPLWAIVTSALPLAQKVTADLERVM